MTVASVSSSRRRRATSRRSAARRSRGPATRAAGPRPHGPAPAAAARRGTRRCPVRRSFNTGCANRAVADVSAVADPNTGVAVYDSFAYQGFSGWLVFGGTSVSSPIIASVYALAGNAASATNNFPYTHDSSSTFNDVTSGSNGTCSPTQLVQRAGGLGRTDRPRHPQRDRRVLDPGHNHAVAATGDFRWPRRVQPDVWRCRGRPIRR